MPIVWQDFKSFCLRLRFGWFLPTFVVDQVWNRSFIAIDHWKALHLAEVTSQFSLSDDMDWLRNHLTRLQPGLNASYCDVICDVCRDGICYLTQQCQHPPSKCAVVIASEPSQQSISTTFLSPRCMIC